MDEIADTVPEPEPARPSIAPSAMQAATAIRDGTHHDVAVESEAVEEPDGTAELGSQPEPDAGPEDAPPAESVAESIAEPVAEPVAVEPTEPPEPLTEEQEAWRALPLQTRVEALLFGATEPLSLRRLQTLAGDVLASDVREALDALRGAYSDGDRAFGVEELGGGFQLRTRPEVADLMARLGRRTENERLSRAALETLAIVAYRQPVLRVDVEKIRGVASGEVLRALVERGLVRIAGRADLPGSPLLYGTTAVFLELFGLKGLGELPSDREMLSRPI